MRPDRMEANLVCFDLELQDRAGDRIFGQNDAAVGFIEEAATAIAQKVEGGQRLEATS
ncbi:MAG: hypothetical protein H0W21_10365 [Actinobacteria bacterium]|nr:hypothetical protein [Actinomycetota bacterium]